MAPWRGRRESAGPGSGEGPRAPANSVSPAATAIPHDPAVSGSGGAGHVLPPDPLPPPAPAPAMVTAGVAGRPPAGAGGGIKRAMLRILKALLGCAMDSCIDAAFQAAVDEAVGMPLEAASDDVDGDLEVW